MDSIRDNIRGLSDELDDYMKFYENSLKDIENNEFRENLKSLYLKAGEASSLDKISKYFYDKIINDFFNIIKIIYENRDEDKNETFTKIYSEIYDIILRIHSFLNNYKLNKYDIVKYKIGIQKNTGNPYEILMQIQHFLGSLSIISHLMCCYLIDQYSYCFFNDNIQEYYGYLQLNITLSSFQDIIFKPNFEKINNFVIENWDKFEKNNYPILNNDVDILKVLYFFSLINDNLFGINYNDNLIFFLLLSYINKGELNEQINSYIKDFILKFGQYNFDDENQNNNLCYRITKILYSDCDININFLIEYENTLISFLENDIKISLQQQRNYNNAVIRMRKDNILLFLENFFWVDNKNHVNQIIELLNNY